MPEVKARGRAPGLREMAAGDLETIARLERGEELSTQPLYLRHADVQMPAARKRVH